MASGEMRGEQGGLNNGQQRGPHSSTKGNMRPLEDTPTGGLHKSRQTTSQGMDNTMKELKLANQGHSSEQPAGQTDDWRQALDLSTRRVVTFPREIY